MSHRSRKPSPPGVATRQPAPARGPGTSSARGATGAATKRRAKPGAKGRAEPRRRRGRALIVSMVVVVALLVGMGLGPLRGYSMGVERVSELEAERARLVHQVDELEDRREALLEDDQVEILAREQLGLVMPGEVPYTVVDPDEDTEQVRPQLEEVSENREAPWYERFARAVTRLFDADG